MCVSVVVCMSEGMCKGVSGGEGEGVCGRVCGCICVCGSECVCVSVCRCGSVYE